VQTAPDNSTEAVGMRIPLARYSTIQLVVPSSIVYYPPPQFGVEDTLVKFREIEIVEYRIPLFPFSPLGPATLTADSLWTASFFPLT